MNKEDHKELRLMVLEIDASGAQLDGWDLKFVSDLIDREVLEFSPKQNEQIIRIYSEVM